MNIISFKNKKVSKKYINNALEYAKFNNHELIVNKLKMIKVNS